MSEWEYSVEIIRLEHGQGAEWSIHDSSHGEIKLANRLNEFGKHGWELVSVLSVLTEVGTALVPPTIYAVFKRIKQS
jgi:hypothetical protein